MITAFYKSSFLNFLKLDWKNTCTAAFGTSSIRFKGIEEAGLYKNERVYHFPPGSEIELESGQKVFERLRNIISVFRQQQLFSAKAALDDHGYGMSSVGSSAEQQTCQGAWEKDRKFFRPKYKILYAACLDAKVGCGLNLCYSEDAIILMP